MLLPLIMLLACGEKEPQDSDAPPDETGTEVVDEDGDGSPSTEDCDDQDATIHPGAEELCDELDNDCDEDVDEGVLQTFWLDGDEDGYGADDFPIEACQAPEGYVDNDDDCNDANDDYHPGATEDDCTDPRDYNCDGSVAYEDADGDGHAACEDCDDSNDRVGPGELEICDDLDNDCDGQVDNQPVDGERYYADSDGDGYGDASVSQKACEQPQGYATNDDDCDDGEAASYPGNTEACDEIDNDCDGDVDEGEGSGSTWYQDKDGDGYGTPYSTKIACLQPNGYVDNDDDCNDNDASVGDSYTWYADTDGDGFGDPNSTSAACTQPSGYVSDATDCDDSDADINTDGVELCDGADNDCDGTTDEDDAADASTFYADNDGDGEGDPNSTTTSCASSVSGYVSNDDDCDDGDANVNTSATETCDTVDNDCDGETDEDDASNASTWYADTDGDSYGDSSDSTVACYQPSGYVSDDTDCDDTDSGVNPGATEACNGVDDDCDQSVDEGFTGTPSTWYADTDGDGEGDPSNTTVDCNQPSGFVANDDDCDDSDANINTSALEYCDGDDNDCDGSTDENDAEDAVTWTVDADGDGYGSDANGATTTVACNQPTGYAASTDDCDDGDSGVNVAATEVCDSIDNDCDNDVDDDDSSVTGQTTWTIDADGDGYGSSSTSASTQQSCEQPSGYVDNADDCDDGDVNVGNALTWYADTDGDGEGDATATAASCTQPSGYVANSDDCDDGDASINTSALEYCDSVDNDCDGSTDENDAEDVVTFYGDGDGDGYGDASVTTDACSAPTGYVSDDTDCDDSNAAVNPGATEICDSVDNDCDNDVDDDDSSVTGQTTWTVDGDGDGFGDDSSNASTQAACDQPSGYVNDASDCDDAESTTYPGADEYCDSVDNDCDGSTDEADAVDAQEWFTDGDGDGYGDPSTGTYACTQPSGTTSQGADCNDNDASIHPGADEYCDNVDNDCDTVTDEDDAVDASTWYADTDGDGYGDPNVTMTSCSQPSNGTSDNTDCDDSSSDTYPGASEVCYDGVVNDCLGTASAALVQCTLSGTVTLNTATQLNGHTDYLAMYKVSGPGDVNGDGYADLLIGLPSDDSTYADGGSVYLSYGPFTTGAVSGDVAVTGGSQNMKLGQGMDWFDYDGDGTDDLVAGAPSVSTDYGKVYVFAGPLSGQLDPSDALTTFTAESAGDRPGDALSWLPDQDGDGIADLLIGAPYDDDGGGNAGAVYLVSGASTGTVALSSQDKLAGEGANDYAGAALSPGGDFDGDGNDDLVVGATGYSNDLGRAYVFFGPVSSASTVLADADVILTGAANQDRLGADVDLTGDFTGDGYADLAAGSPYYDGSFSDAGAVFVVFGGTTSTTFTPSTADLTMYGKGPLDHFGTSVVGVEDLDGDGASELLVGAQDTKSQGTSSGTAYLFYGNGTAQARIDSQNPGDRLGSWGAYVGDTDGDGIGELAVSGYGVDGGGTDRGAIYLLEVAAY